MNYRPTLFITFEPLLYAFNIMQNTKFYKYKPAAEFFNFHCVIETTGKNALQNAIFLITQL